MNNSGACRFGQSEARLDGPVKCGCLLYVLLSSFGQPAESYLRAGCASYASPSPSMHVEFSKLIGPRLYEAFYPQELSFNGVEFL